MRKDDLITLVRTDGEWCFVENAITKAQGFVPPSFIAPNMSLNAEPWFFGHLTRQKVRDARPRVSRQCPLLPGRKAAGKPHAQARQLPHPRERGMRALLFCSPLTRCRASRASTRCR